MWADRRLTDRLGIEHPILQAPMAGAADAAMAIEVCEAGGLGAIPAAMLDEAKVRSEIARVRAGTTKPFNVNFFCHETPADDPARLERWRAKLAPYYAELGVDPSAAKPGAERRPFDEERCRWVEDLRPAVVSFHFGLPAAALLERVKAAGCTIIATATTVEEAVWLDARGVDAVIAQGAEAGGHRGMFLTEDVGTQIGTFALVPQIVDAVRAPVIAAGGIMDGRTIVAALALGAAAVQLGTAYLHCPEALIPAAHRAALGAATRSDATAITNVFTGRPARGFVNRFVREVGPVDREAPRFPLAARGSAPLRAKAESAGSTEFSPMWAGQAARLGRALPARELTSRLVHEAAERLAK